MRARLVLASSLIFCVGCPAGGVNAPKSPGKTSVPEASPDATAAPTGLVAVLAGPSGRVVVVDAGQNRVRAIPAEPR